MPVCFRKYLKGWAKCEVSVAWLWRHVLGKASDEVLPCTMMSGLSYPNAMHVRLDKNEEWRSLIVFLNLKRTCAECCQTESPLYLQGTPLIMTRVPGHERTAVTIAAAYGPAWSPWTQQLTDLRFRRVATQALTTSGMRGVMA